MSHPLITFSKDLSEPYGSRRQLSRAVAAGQLARPARGAFVDADSWAAASRDEKYRLQVIAVAETRRFPVVLSHWSAAVLHGLPIIGPWPKEVHVVVGPTSGGRSRNGVVKHSSILRDEDVTIVDGLLVTSITRTIVDIAASTHFMIAVVMADRALHRDSFDKVPPLTTKAELWEQWQSRLPFRGHQRTSSVIDFAADLSGSALESVSRVTMHRIGCPAPTLQQTFWDSAGKIGDTDFSWDEFDAVGEADGDAKYLNPRLMSGRTAEQVVLDEKIREDRLRALPKSVARWRWDVAMNPLLLTARLRAAGVVIP